MDDDDHYLVLDRADSDGDGYGDGDCDDDGEGCTA